MIYYHDTTEFHIDGPCAVALGKFDGIHRGHQKLIRRILAYAKEHPGCKSAVFALNARDEQLILTQDEQREFLEAMGVDCLIQCPFVPEIYTMTAEEFVKRILRDSLGTAFAAVGTDFRFGHHRAGDAAYLKEAGRINGFETGIVEHEMFRGQKISSTGVRDALLGGDVTTAEALLGRAYSIRGSVVRGAHLGTQIGIPTANLIPPAGKLLPQRGVYVSETLLEGKVFRSVTDVGTKPTVDGSYEGAETFIFDLKEELYGKEIEVRLLEHIRKEMKFGGIDELIEQIRSDIRQGEEYFNGKRTFLS